MPVPELKWKMAARLALSFYWLLITGYWPLRFARGLLTKPARERSKLLFVRGRGYGHALHVVVHGRSGPGTLRNAETLLVQDFFKRGQELQHVSLLA
jgi:hypothetical protein